MGCVGEKKLKNIKIDLDNEAIKAFENIRKIISPEDILLQQPDFIKAFELTLNAASTALGAVLAQKGKPITFISRTLY
jgi:hypothetical protein